MVDGGQDGGTDGDAQVARGVFQFLELGARGFSAPLKIVVYRALRIHAAERAFEFFVFVDALSHRHHVAHGLRAAEDVPQPGGFHQGHLRFFVAFGRFPFFGEFRAFVVEHLLGKFDGGFVGVQAPRGFLCNGGIVVDARVGVGFFDDFRIHVLDPGLHRGDGLPGIPKILAAGFE